jgi:hypothetical protein
LDFLIEEVLLLLSTPGLILGDFNSFEPTAELLFLLTPRFLGDRGDGDTRPSTGKDMLLLTLFCDLGFFDDPPTDKSVEAAELLLLLLVTFFFVDGDGDIISSASAFLLGFTLRFFVFLLFLPFLPPVLSLRFSAWKDLLLPFRLMLLLSLLSSLKSMSPISSEVSPDVSSIANSVVMFTAPDSILLLDMQQLVVNRGFRSGIDCTITLGSWTRKRMATAKGLLGRFRDYDYRY